MTEENDIAIIIHPENKECTKYSFEMKIPDHIQKELEKESVSLPEHILFAFQLAAYVNNQDNLKTINEYFEKKLAETQGTK